MPEWQAYKSRPKLLDVTVSAIAANQTDFPCPVSGAATTGSNVAQLTDAGITSVMPQGQVGDGLLVVVDPVIQDASTFPDCEIWFANGTESQRGYQTFDVGYQPLMLPAMDRAAFNPEVAQALLLLGMSTRDALRLNAADIAAGGPGLPNLPTLITGYKVTSQLQLHVASKAGWSSPIQPLRVRVYGDFLTATDLEELGTLPYTGDISWEIPPTLPFQATHVWPGLGTINGWKGGPGGTGQTGVKVNRRILYAYNAANATGLFVMSEQNGVRGSVGNVSSADTTNGKNTYHDMGSVFRESDNALFIDRFGFNLYNSGDAAYVSWQIDGQTVPQETTNGKRVSYAINDLAYGAASTTGGSGSQVVTLPNVDNLARVLMHKNNVAPAFQPTSGTGTINAGNASAAMAGTLVEVA